MKINIKKICIITLILFSVAMFIATNFISQTAVVCANPTTVSSSAKSMIVIETSQGKVLYAKNENEKLPMASTTKIVTALTVIENVDDIDKLVTVPKKATLVEGSSIYLRENEQLTIKQLLYGLMLQSGNDAALTLALEVGKGSVEAFADMMNETALKYGCKDSHFVTPHGLDDKEHFTTASDLAKITAVALKNSIFREIVSCQKFIIRATEHNTARTLINKNKLLKSLDGCIGVKTGYTKKSGRCLVSACNRDGMEVVCVVLSCGPMFEESMELINKAYEEYRHYDIISKYKVVDNITVDNGENATTRIFHKNGFSVVCKKGDEGRYTVKYDYPTTCKAPIEKGQKVGEVKIYFDNDLIFVDDLCSIEDVKVIKPETKIQDILEKW
ncbi:MAG: D-alanyl-D-alanine carboxypeptidase family protein [Christensenellales bacterium]